jgi:hypothetical protein
VPETRGANEWMTPANELAAFKIDPRFEVNLFASEEQFPEIANPIQMRWDTRGRLWVSCSTTYPHVYPGMEPRDRLVILEDTDGDLLQPIGRIVAPDEQLSVSQAADGKQRNPGNEIELPRRLIEAQAQHANEGNDKFSNRPQHARLGERQGQTASRLPNTNMVVRGAIPGAVFRGCVCKLECRARHLNGFPQAHND